MRTLKPLLVCLALLLPGAAAYAQTSGTLTSVAGSVFVKTGEGAEQAARQGDTVEPGARLRTGDDGNAEVTFGDGSKLQIRPGTQVALSGTKRPEKKSSIVLFFGRVWSKVTRSVGGDTSYEVNTPNAVAGVRGTEFETAVADDGTAKVRVTEGKVAVSSDAGNQGSSVTKGQESVATGEGVGDPTQSGDPNWDEFKTKGTDSARQRGGAIATSIRTRLDARKQKLQDLRSQQSKLIADRDAALKQAQMGDSAAAQRVKDDEKQIAALGSQIADLADQSESQFGYVDHLADLAGDPRFGMIDRKTMLAEANTLRRLKRQFDAMVKEGTDLSQKSMNQMMDDMQKGKPTIKDKKGSSAKDLFDQ